MCMCVSPSQHFNSALACHSHALQLLCHRCKSSVSMHLHALQLLCHRCKSSASMQDVGGTCSSTSGAPSPPASPPHHRWNVSRARRSTPREALVVDAAAAARGRSGQGATTDARQNSVISLSVCTFCTVFGFLAIPLFVRIFAIWSCGCECRY